MSRMECSLGPLLTKLQEWYRGRCDGDWEHSYGIVIETLDNPGWSVKIDLSETPWENVDTDGGFVDRGDSDWFDYKVFEKQFLGHCAIGNLSDVLNAFCKMIEEGS